MPMAVQFMADAVAGGDTKKLAKMMEQGQVDPIEALPKFFAALKKEATPFMNDFYNSIEARRGKAQKATEDWMRNFMDGGAGEGVASFFTTWEQIVRDSVPHAAKIGKYFQAASYYMQAAMLAPGEIISWLKGEGGEGNFMQALFGNVDESGMATSLKNLIREIADTFKISVGQMTNSVDVLKNILVLLGTILAPIVQKVADVISLLNAWDEGGYAQVKWQMQTNSNRETARSNVLERLKSIGINPSNVDVDAMAATEFRKLQQANPRPSDVPWYSGSMNPGVIGSTMAGWFANVDKEVQSLPGGRTNPLNWIQGYTGLGNRTSLPPDSLQSYPSTSITNDSKTLNGNINITIDAKVEARTDAEAIQTAIEQGVRDGIDTRLNEATLSNPSPLQ